MEGTKGNNENHSYLVEVIYKKVYIDTSEQDQPRLATRIESQTYAFENANKSVARTDAGKFMDNTIRTGLKLSGGSVVKSMILPTALLQIGIIDPSLDEPLAEPVAAAVSTNMETAAKAAPIDVVATS